MKRMRRKTAEDMRKGLNRMMCRFPRGLLRTITYDNGPEYTDHQGVNKVLGARSYFCAPFHSWERGTAENTIGLVRRRLPKKTDFATVSDRQVKAIERWANNRPRKCLDYETPAEAFRASVALTG